MRLQAVAGLVRVLEIREMSVPVEALGMKLARQVEERGVAGAVVEPDDAQHLFGPAVLGPRAQRALRRLLQVVLEVLAHDRNDAGVTGHFLVLRERFEHDHVRPPIGIGNAADRAVFPLVLERPVDPLLRLGDQRLVFEEVGQRQETIQVVRPSLPALTWAAEPGAVRPDIRPDLLEVAGEPVGLDAQLLLQPATRLHRAERQRPERVVLEGFAVPVHLGCGRVRGDFRTGARGAGGG